MARNRKKRGLGEATPAAPKVEVKPVEPPKPKRGPTPKKVKVKRPKYVRPPRAPSKPKAAEPTGPKPLTFAALTLTSAVARSIPKAGTDLPDRSGPGPK